MMRYLKTALLFITILFSGCAGTRSTSDSGKTADLQHIIDKYYQAIDSIAKTHPFRLGVISFASNEGGPSDTTNEFGRYIAEKLTSRLASAANRIKIYERSRLDAIFKENSLSLSGMINENEAMKIGELVPIDYLFTGTFIVLKQQLSLSGHLIDVTTGEIVYASSDECDLTDDIVALFPVQLELQNDCYKNTSQAAGNSINCIDIQASIDKKIAAAKPDDQFSVLIDEGIKIPFDTVCPQIHYDIIQRCRRANANPVKYTNFLIATLRSIKEPDSDDRMYEIFRYFSADHRIDDNEWAAGCEALGRVGMVERYVDMLIIEDTLNDVLEQRIADLAVRCSRKEIGTHAVAFDNILYDIFFQLGMFGRSTVSSNRRNPRELQQIHDALHLFDKFSPGFTWSIPEKFTDLFKDLWNRDRYSSLGDTLFFKVCESAVHIKKGSDFQVIEQVAGILVRDLFTRDAASVQSWNGASCAAQLFADKCRQQLIARAEYVKEKHFSSTDIPALCLFTGIESPLVPTNDSISLWLSSEKLGTANEGADCAIYMDKKAIIFEDKLIRVLRQRIRKDIGGEYDNSRIIRALGVSRTAKPEACELLLLCLDSLNYRFPPSEIVRALSLIGKPAIPYVKKYFEKDPDSHAYYAADFFEQLGSESKAYIPYLVQKTRLIGNSKAKYYLEDAVERMKQKL